MQEIPVVTFNDKDQPDFYKTLKKRVNAHFKEKNRSKHANVNMVLKTFFMIALYFTPLALMISGVITSFWMMMLMWSIMGFGMAGIGLAIMHDANHGAYSKSQRVNNIVGFILNFMGGYQYNWKIQHNVLHHSFTNVDGYDEDIEKQGLVRFSPNQERKKFFRFQIYYVPFLYGILTLYWFVFKDIEQTIRYNKKNLLQTQGLTFRKAMTQVIFHKIWYFVLTILLPIYMLDLPWWTIIIGFVTMQFIAGMILALIFQSAHVIEETEFYETDSNGCVENNWAIHQMKTTANFANGSIFFSWFIGALNYQIEHHLFPNICHVHYRDLAKIVKETAKEYNVPYHEHKTFAGALKSHFSLLNDLGTGKYDQKLAAASV